MNIWDALSEPFFVLAPMDDVTDTVFRQIIANLAPPDLFFTEFVNVEALQSPGREKTLPRLKLGSHEGISRLSHARGVQGRGEQRTEPYTKYGEGAEEPLTQQSPASTGSVSGSAEKQDGTVRKSWPIIAQIWGLNPENFYKAAQDIAGMGYDGIDLNFGCPIKNVVANGACSALILPENRGRAVEMIQAVREGAPSLPLSVKTRLGYSQVDLTWHELLLKQKLNALSIHGRTKAQMSKVPADWDKISEIRELRDQIFPATKIIGNGDVTNRAHGLELAKNHKLDGIMIGRGIFDDPFVFAKKSPWADYTKQQKADIYRRHIELFASTWQHDERRLVTLNKFCKIYIHGFDGAKEMREKLMAAQSIDELLQLLHS